MAVIRNVVTVGRIKGFVQERMESKDYKRISAWFHDVLSKGNPKFAPLKMIIKAWTFALMKILYGKDLAKTGSMVFLADRYLCDARPEFSGLELPKWAKRIMTEVFGLYASCNPTGVMLQMRGLFLYHAIREAMMDNLMVESYCAGSGVAEIAAFASINIPQTEDMILVDNDGYCELAFAELQRLWLSGRHSNSFGKVSYVVGDAYDVELIKSLRSKNSRHSLGKKIHRFSIGHLGMWRNEEDFFQGIVSYLDDERVAALSFDFFKKGENASIHDFLKYMMRYPIAKSPVDKAGAHLRELSDIQRIVEKVSEKLGRDLVMEIHDFPFGGIVTLKKVSS
jgi:hypothetical protein